MGGMINYDDNNAPERAFFLYPVWESPGKEADRVCWAGREAYP
jgi:hypothetical protein